MGQHLSESFPFSECRELLNFTNSLFTCDYYVDEVFRLIDVNHNYLIVQDKHSILLSPQSNTTFELIDI